MKINTVHHIVMGVIICALCFCGIHWIAEQIIKTWQNSKQTPKEQKTSVVIQPFNPIYEIDPRQKEGKIFYFVKTTNGYDTIQHGQLENFIINDNE